MGGGLRKTPQEGHRGETEKGRDAARTTTGGTLSQTRSSNAVNEIAGISGGNWMTPPTYDAAGNMTAGPWPGNETAVLVQGVSIRILLGAAGGPVGGFQNVFWLAQHLSVP
jgi:hypothetical protein